MTGGKRRWIWVTLGWAALVGFFVVMLGVIAALAFSVTVAGTSMAPTVADGDRLLVDPFGPDEIERFDIVESTLGDREIPVIKRVIGMPGDEVTVREKGGVPQVFVRPAGESSTYVVESTTWPDSIGASTATCCQPDGISLAPGAPARWVTVPEDAYWVVGDNWGGSDDSRTYGFVAADAISAEVVLRLLPAGGFGGLDDPARLVPTE